MTAADLPLADRVRALTEAHHEIMRHSLGLTQAKESYRNYFCAGEGHADMPLINDLIAAGCMRASHTINQGRDTIYVVTEAGRALLTAKAGESSHD